MTFDIIILTCLSGTAIITIDNMTGKHAHAYNRAMIAMEKLNLFVCDLSPKHIIVIKVPCPLKENIMLIKQSVNSSLFTSCINVVDIFAHKSDR